MGVGILLVDNDPQTLQRLLPALHAEGFAVSAHSSRMEALAELERREYDVAVVELDAGAESEIAFLAQTRRRAPATEVILASAKGDVHSAVAAMKLGAFHYLPKPYEVDDLVVLVKRAMEKRLLHLEVRELRDMVRDKRLPALIGKSPAMLDLRRNIARVAPLDCNVLIRGETGTGKELVSRTIHLMSSRADKRFLAVNCGAFNAELLANELFGHEKEAYTGAQRTKKGVFEAIEGGTLLLDEIGEMPVSMQVKLLRVLQEKIVMRVGGTEERPVDVRLLAATNRPLEADIDRGAFRQDLFYRLNVFTLRLPPLRERTDDIPLFCHYFLEKYAAQFGKKVTGFSDEVVDVLQSYTYPGNVRELENIVERAIVLADDEVIQAKHLPARMRPSRAGSLESLTRDHLIPLAELEQRYIRDVLGVTGGNKSKAAEILGIDRATLWRKLQRNGKSAAK